MKKNKIVLVRIFNITTWSTIILLTCYVLIKSCVVFTSADMRQTIRQFEKGITLDIGQNMLKSNIPLLNYLNTETAEDNMKNNLYINSFVRVFPISKYILYSKENVLNAKNTGFFNNDYFDNNIANSDANSDANSNASSDASNNDTIHDDTSNNNYFITGAVSVINGESYYEDETTSNVEESTETISNRVGKTYSMSQLKNFQFVMNNFFTVDNSTQALESVIDGEKLAKESLKIKMDKKHPQILIFHTHSQEAFADSRSGNNNDSVIGVGSYLTKILTKKYGINVLHDTYPCDIINGNLDRNKAYNVAEKRLPTILKNNPSIEVIIDLHRDDGTKRVTTINGKKTAQIMFFNGLSRNQRGPIDYLYNPYIKDNLAFSLQMKLKAEEIYPGLTKKIYLKGYRYNMHFLPKSLLIELGTDENTLEEAKNAMEPLADILYQVLTGETIE